MIKAFRKKIPHTPEQTHLNKKVGFALKSAPPASSNVNFTVDLKKKKSTGIHSVEEKKNATQTNDLKNDLKKALKQQAKAILSSFQSGILIKGKSAKQKKTMNSWIGIQKNDLSNLALSKSKNEITALIFQLISNGLCSSDPKEVAAWAKKHSAWLWEIIVPLKTPLEERMTVKPISTAGKKK